MNLDFNSELNNDQKAFVNTAQQFAKEHKSPHFFNKFDTLTMQKI